MRRIVTTIVIALGALVGATQLSAQATPAHTVWDPATAVWEASGKGLESSLILGDTRQPGSYAIAFRLAPGAWIPPHTHPRPKQVTVLSGALLMGFGPALDSTAVHRMTSGQITVVPPGTAHYEGARERTVVIFSGDGPLVTNWIR